MLRRMRLQLAIVVLAISVVDARADRLVASSTHFGSVGDPDVMYIHRIGESSITEVHREMITSTAQLVWTDARTLWVLTDTIAPYTAKVQKFVDGAEVETSTLAAADWKISTVFTEVFLRVTKSGEIWLETCVAGTPSPMMGVKAICKQPGYLRVDTKPYKLVTKKPAFRDSSPTPTTAKQQALGDGLFATLRSRTLDEMHGDPKPYDGLWKLERNKHVLGEIPGEQLLLAPR
jgi:hypothetical protein